MGLFDKFAKAIGLEGKAKEYLGDIVETIGDSIEETIKDKAEDNKAENTIINAQDDLVILGTSHLVEGEEYADDDKYRVTFMLNDAFKKANSHAAEVSMLNTYAPNAECGEEGNIPYIAIQCDDDVYCAVEDFKVNGTFDSAIELTPLNGKFYFKAKMEYYSDMMYFYGIDRCDGFWENNGLCLVYPKEYAGTENEAKLMRVLDEVAESYTETKVE